MITEAQEQALISMLTDAQLSEERLADEEPWGEDGPVEAFERGQQFGRNDLAEEILALLGH